MFKKTKEIIVGGVLALLVLILIIASIISLISPVNADYEKETEMKQQEYEQAIMSYEQASVKLCSKTKELANTKIRVETKKSEPDYEEISRLANKSQKNCEELLNKEKSFL